MAQRKSSIQVEDHATDVLWGGDPDKVEAAASAEATDTTEETGSDATSPDAVGLVVPFAGDTAAVPEPAEPTPEPTPEPSAATLVAPVDEAAELARVAANNQVIMDALANGRRVEEVNPQFPQYKRVTEYIAGTNGSIDDARVRLSYETTRPDGTVDVFTRYFDAHKLEPSAAVWFTRSGGVETVTKAAEYTPGSLDLHVGDTRSIPSSVTTAAGLAPASWDPKADGSLGMSRPPAIDLSGLFSDGTQSSGSGTGSAATPTTSGAIGGSAAATDFGIDRHTGFDEPPDTSTDPGGSSASPTTEPGHGSATAPDGDSDSSPIDDALNNLSEPSSAEPDAPSSRGGDASTDGLSWPGGVDPGSGNADSASSTVHGDVDVSGEDATFQTWPKGTGGFIWRENADGTRTAIDPDTFTEVDPSGASKPSGETSGSTEGSSSGGSSSAEAVKGNTGEATDTHHPGDTSDSHDGTDDGSSDSGTSGSDDTGEEGYIVDDGYSSAGDIPVAEGHLGDSTTEVAGSGHAQMAYSGVFGTFYGTLEHAQTGNPEVVWGDYANPTDETASGPPTQADAHIPSADPLIHVDPDVGGDVGTLELHDLQTSIHGGDFVDPNDPLFGNDTSIIQGSDPHDTSPYEHGTGDMSAESAPGDDLLD